MTYFIIMKIEKVVKIRSINDPQLIIDDLNYWRNKSPEERLSAVEILRRQFYGNTTRLQRVVRVVKQK